jgi:transcriptional regulator with XRE-family HTH domain
MNEIQEELMTELRDPDYRHGYAGEYLDMVLARQIRALRKQRGMTQQQLADAIGSKQPFISEIEDEEYGSLSISTLKVLAGAFDTYLDVKFTSFGDLVKSIGHTSMQDLQVPTFDEDPFFQVATKDSLSPAEGVADDLSVNLSNTVFGGSTYARDLASFTVFSEIEKIEWKEIDPRAQAYISGSVSISTNIEPLGSGATILKFPKVA